MQIGDYFTPSVFNSKHTRVIEPGETLGPPSSLFTIGLEPRAVSRLQAHRGYENSRATSRGVFS